MNTVVERETAALRRIYENNLYNPVDKDIAGSCIQEMRLPGSFVVVLDGYQLWRESCDLSGEVERNVEKTGCL